MSPCSSSRAASSRASTWNDRRGARASPTIRGWIGGTEVERIGPLGPPAIQRHRLAILLDPSATLRDHPSARDRSGRRERRTACADDYQRLQHGRRLAVEHERIAVVGDPRSTGTPPRRTARRCRAGPPVGSTTTAGARRSSPAARPPRSAPADGSGRTIGTARPGIAASGSCGSRSKSSPSPSPPDPVPDPPRRPFAPA